MIGRLVVTTDANADLFSFSIDFFTFAGPALLLLLPFSITFRSTTVKANGRRVFGVGAGVDGAAAFLLLATLSFSTTTMVVAEKEDPPEEVEFELLLCCCRCSTAAVDP